MENASIDVPNARYADGIIRDDQASQSLYRVETHRSRTQDETDQDSSGTTTWSN